MDPGQEKIDAANRGAALWGNFVIRVTNYPARVIATDKETGKVAWETNMGDGQPELALTAAPLPVKDKIVIGAAGGASIKRPGCRSTTIRRRTSRSIRACKTRP
jgi:alcohol dehydrogenase (cytochrome c)